MIRSTALRTSSFAVVVGLLSLGGCKSEVVSSTKDGEIATTTQPAQPAQVAQPNKYPMCTGQNSMQSFAGVNATGPVTQQLAPAFLDKMQQCGEKAPANLIASAGEGKINAKGDCEFAAVQVSCHYHTGQEFLTTSKLAQEKGVGELHCIFPTANGKSPNVFGGPIRCAAGTSVGGAHAAVAGHGAPTGHHAAQVGASCSAQLLNQLNGCANYNCCDTGTLTNPIAALQSEGRNDVRPNFRICSQVLEIDCNLLSTMTGHDANAPAIGGIGEAVFP